MSERTKKALENHDKNYNCCQSVACAYCDLLGIDEATMFKAGEAFGLGMGCMGGTCGAITGAILKEFEDKNGAIACRDLKGIDTGTPLRSCPGCIEDAAEIAEKVLELK